MLGSTCRVHSSIRVERGRREQQGRVSGVLPSQTDRTLFRGPHSFGLELVSCSTETKKELL
jgi:hypothetical protein